MKTVSRSVTAAITLVIAAVVASACQVPDGFYETSTTDITGEPGDIARSFSYDRGFVVDADGNQQAQQAAHVVIYQSTSAVGEANLVSGTVIVPVSPWTGESDRPIAAMAPGTQGMADRCAPSRSLSTAEFGEESQVEALLAEGFAVAVTDYEGLGTSGDHTYSVVDAQAHALLDMARAARNLAVGGVGGDSPVVLLGFSQGGATSARAAEIEATYAPDLQVQAIVAGGVPTDPARQVEWVSDGLGRGFAGGALLSIMGLSTAYPELESSDVLNTDGLDLIAQLNELCALDALYLASTADLGVLIDQTAIDGPDWAARVSEQLLGTVAPAVPTLIYHGTGDVVVPIDQGLTLRDSWCDLGASVEFQEFSGGHFFVGPVAEPYVTNWLSEQVAGTAVLRSDCTIPTPLD